MAGTVVKSFTFNAFSENTYVVSNDAGECMVVDAGMYEPREERVLLDYMAEKGLWPVKLVNTHCHIDHVLGNNFMHEQYGLLPIMPEGELNTLHMVQAWAEQMGFGKYKAAPPAVEYLSEADGTLLLGDAVFTVIDAPGHSPAHVCLYNARDGYLLAGDVLFYESIGRTDLPGGDHNTLIQNIRQKLFMLPDDTIVYPGHGPATTIGHEKRYNMYLKG